MILRHLRYFSAVAEHGSIVAAASALRLAQPSLSRQMRDLERAAGAPLLERTRRGIRTTPAGAALLSGAHEIPARLEEALNRARRAHHGTLGTLRLALGRAALESSRVGRALAALRERLPGIDLEVTETESFAQPAALVEGVADLAIGLHGACGHRGICREALFSEHANCAMISASHPLATASSIHPSQLRAERLMIMDPAIARGWPDLLDAIRRLHDGPVETLASVSSLYGMVAAGRGWAPALSAARKNPPPGTTVIPLAGFSVRMSLSVSWRSDDQSRLIGNVIAVLREAAEGSHETTSLDARLDHHTSRDDAGTQPTVPAVPVGPVGPVVPVVPRGLESRHLRALTVTVAEGSVSRAATRLGITQSGLSRQLRALENEIGVELFRRGASGMVPNAAAAVFNADALAILAIIDSAVAQARGMQQERRPSRPCRIGAVPNELTGDLVFSAIRQMTERFPDTAIEIIETLTSFQISALRNQEIDVGVGRIYPGTADDPAIDAMQVGYDVVECALISTLHPLASRTRLAPADLADIPFLFVSRPAHPQLFDAVMRAFDQIGLTPRVEGTFVGARTLWRLVADEMGWTVGSRYQRANPPSGLIAVPIDGLRIPTGIQILWRRDEDDERVKALLAILCVGRVGAARDTSALDATHAAELASSA
ncbi:MAG: LysR substrate-binding domain-containing protein [bacterium]